MADFVAVLKKTIEGLNDKSPEMREKVYRKARDTIAAKLAAISPPPSRIVVDRQIKALEDAIAAVEASYATTPVEDDFENVLAELEKRPSPAAEAATPAQVAPAPSPATTANETEEKPAPAPFPAYAGDAGDELFPSHRHEAADDTSREDDEALTPVTPAPRSLPPLPPLAGGVDTETEEARPRRSVSMALVAALVALIVVGAGGYGIWLNRDSFSGLFGSGGSGTVAEQEPAASEEQAPPAQAPADTAQGEKPGEQVASAPQEQPAASPPPAAEEAAAPKFTQRLTADGREIDEGPAGAAQQSVGEGTSLAQASEAQTTPEQSQPAPATSGAAQPGAPQPQQPAGGGEQAVPVGQRAIFYEERTSAAEGTADNGTTVWSLVQESPGNDLPPEPAIRGEVSIPGKGVQLKMTIRRNADKTLPASHIIEMIFLGNFEGGGIDNVLRVALKGSEAAPGNPLIGIPAKIADGYFLVALSDTKAERDTNLELLLRQSWIDIPIVYKSGRRALVTMEKGVPGDKVFQEALQAWQNATSG